jgi:hypothetical protein
MKRHCTLFLLLITLIRVNGATIYVNAAGGNNANSGLTPALAKATINAAIAVANTGDIIDIAPGTYTENVVVNKSITLNGQDRSTCILRGSFGGATDIGISITPNINNIFIDHLTVTNYHHGLARRGTGNTSDLHIDDCSFVLNNNCGIYCDAVGLIQNFSVSNSSLSNNDNDAANNNGRGLFFTNAASLRLENIRIINSTMSYNRIAGMDFSGQPGQLNGIEVSGCTFAGTNVVGQVQDAALAISASNVLSATYPVLITNNYIEMYGRFGMEIKSAKGNGATSGIGSFVISNNHIVSSPQAYTAGATLGTENRDRAGILVCNVFDYGDPDGAVIMENTVDGVLQTAANFTYPAEVSTGFGIVISGTNIQVLNNEVINCNVGIQAQFGNKTANSCTGTSTCQAITNDKFFNRDVATTHGGHAVNYNVLSSCTYAVRNVGTVSDVLNALGNYWDNATGPTHTSLPSGTGGNVYDITTTWGGGSSVNYVAYNPFYTTAIDAVSGTAPGQRGVQFPATPLTLQANIPAHGVDMNPAPRSIIDDAVRLSRTTVADIVNIEEGFHPGQILVDKTIVFTNNGIPPSIDQLTMDGAGIQLQLTAFLSIANSATFNNGIVKNLSGSLLIFQDNAVSSPGNANSFVDGPVQKIGNDAFIFPVGEEGQGVHYIGMSAPDDINDILTAEYYPANPRTNVGNTLATPLISITPCEYWNLDNSNDAGAPNTITVTLQYAPTAACLAAINPPTLVGSVVAGFDGSIWQDEGQTATSGTSVSGSITSGGANVFNFFTWASTMEILPVRLLSFKGARSGHAVVLQWKVADEKYVNKYILEKQTTGNFTPVGEVKSFNNTPEQVYSMSDMALPAGVARYRLKIISMDGRISYSPIATIAAPGNDIAVLENPVKDNIHLLYNTARFSNNAVYTIYNTTGSKVQSGRLQTTIPVTTLPKGMYVLQITDQKQVKFKNFIK